MCKFWQEAFKNCILQSKNYSKMRYFFNSIKSCILLNIIHFYDIIIIKRNIIIKISYNIHLEII